MKKLVTIVLAVLLVSAMSITAFAAEGSLGLGGSGGKDITGKYGAGGVNTAVYSVDITWGSMVFTYAGGTWDPDTHTYDSTGWTPDNTTENSNVVTVTNHSNKTVAVDVAFTTDAAFDGKVTGAVTGGTFNLAAPAVGSTQADAPKASATLALSGNLGDTTLAAAGSTLGRITVTVAEPTP